MAGMVDILNSNRDLWLFITGSSLPLSLVSAELKRNDAMLTKVLSSYEKPNSASADRLRKDSSIPAQQLEFILKLASCLDLDQVQCSDLLCGYLLRDYRGSKKELQEMWVSERYSRLLIQRVREKYATERLYLLRCLKHLLSFFEDDQHPYKSAFAEVVEPLYRNSEFIDRVTNQYLEMSQQAAPAWTTSSNISSEKSGTEWLIQNLREQCELMELMLLYYRTSEHKLDCLHRFLDHCRKQGFGHCQICRHLVDDKCEALLRRIGFLQVLLILEGLELEKYTGMPASESIPGGMLDTGNFELLSKVIIELGDAVEHGPLLLTWAAVTQLHSDVVAVGSAASAGHTLARKLGKRAVQRGALEYLSSQLCVEPFNGKTVVASMSHGIVYGLLTFVLDRFHEDTLGDNQGMLSTVGCLLQKQFIADDFWIRGLDDGLGNLLQLTLFSFPLSFNEPMSLMIALAKAGAESASQVVNLLQQLQLYSEHLDKSTDVRPATDDQAQWMLVSDRVPCGLEETNFILPHGTRGQIIHQSVGRGGVTNVIQWSSPYSGWDVMLGEVQHLLNQVAFGAGMVQVENVHKVTLVCRLLSAILSMCGAHVLKTVPQCEQLVNSIFHVVHRFSVLPSPSLDLIAGCLDVFTQLIPFQTQQVWSKLKQIGFLPYLTHSLTDMSQSIRFVNCGAYGTLLAGCECIMGKYPVTESLLQFMLAITQSGIEFRETTAYVLYISQQVFPVLHKFRYYNPRSRERISNMCLEIFNKILSLPFCENLTSSPTTTELSIEHVVVQSLLFTEASRTLLDIIKTGDDAVEAGLASQGSAFEGTGIDLIKLLCSALSALNRLLQLWPLDAAKSPIAQTLSMRPVGRTERHLVTTIAQYIYHRVNPQLPCLATRLLKTLALLFPMSMLACLGSEAESIRDVYLMRLHAFTEDVELKVDILEWLSVCIETQPGVIELFLSIEFVDEKAGQKELCAGKGSCLQTILSLINEDRQSEDDVHCPAELLAAATGFIHALWRSRQQSAMTVLRKNSGFWHCLCLCLQVDLPTPEEDNEPCDVMEVKTRSNVFKILSLELYQLNSVKLEESLLAELKLLITKQRLAYWSEFLGRNINTASVSTGRELSIKIKDHPTMQLLLGWRDFIVVLSSTKIDGIALKDDIKDNMLSGILHCVEIQFCSRSMDKLQMKLASIASASYLMVLRYWCRDIIQLWLNSSSLTRVRAVLEMTYMNTEIHMPSVQIALLSALSLVLHEVRSSSTQKRVGRDQLASLLPVVCKIVQISTNQLEIDSFSSVEKPENLMNNDNRFKLQTAAASLLQDLIISMDINCPNLWLPTLKDHSILQCLLSTACTLLQVRQGSGLIQAVLTTLLVLCRNRESAEALAVNGINLQLCLPLVHFYSNSSSIAASSQDKSSSQYIGYTHSIESSVYRLYLSLMSSMLERLKYGFVADAINFIGVHQQRLHQCLESTGRVLSEEALLETDETSYLLSRLSPFQREWRLELPASLQLLMTDVCMVTQTCVGLLIRPSLMQHIVEQQAKEKQSQTVSALCSIVTTSISRHLLHQASIDDADPCTPELLSIQHRLLKITSNCLVALRNFSPNVCDLLLSQTFDVSTFDAFIGIAFGVPSADKHVTGPTFGTLVSIANLCLKLLSKIDGTRLPATSPQKPQTPNRMYACESNPIKRPLVMFVMENALVLILSQSMRHLRDSTLSQRDKQLLKRELGAELNSFLIGLQRHLRSTSSTPPSPQLGRASLGGRTSLNTSQFSTEHAYFKLMDAFVKQILR